MLEKEVTIKNETGLHARPATLFVKKASSFSADIEITKDDKTVNAKSIMGVMSLGAGKGSKVKLKAEGDDEQEAIEALVELIDQGLSEQEGG